MDPERTCIGCRHRGQTVSMVRVTLQEGSLQLGRDRPGRGAWLCSDPACLDRAIARRAFPRALRADVGLHAIDELRLAFVDQHSDARG